MLTDSQIQEQLINNYTSARENAKDDGDDNYIVRDCLESNHDEIAVKTVQIFNAKVNKMLDDSEKIDPEMLELIFQEIYFDVAYELCESAYTEIED